MRNHLPNNFRTALFLLAVVCIWQVGALVHLVTVSHEICPHGKIVDAHGHVHDHDHSRGDDADNTSSPAAPERHQNHDNCRQLASLTTANAAPQAAAVLPIAAVQLSLLVVFDVVERAFYQRDLYMTAPCHSPPARA